MDPHKQIEDPLKALYSLFDLPSHISGKDGKKQSINIKERHHNLELMDKTTKEEFDKIIDTSKAKIISIYEKMAGLHLGCKELLLRTIELADPTSICNKNLYREPLKDLFNCNNNLLETTVVVNDTPSRPRLLCYLRLKLKKSKMKLMPVVYIKSIKNLQLMRKMTLLQKSKIGAV